MRYTCSTLTVIILVLGLCVPINAGATVPLDEPLAQIQVVLVNDAPADVPTIEQVQIKRASGTTEPGRVGMQLFKDDEVTTGSGVQVSLLFDKANSEDQVQVQVHENSRARIGSFWAYVGRFLVSGWGTFDTRTQEVRLGKRKTEFYVEVSEEGSVEVKVLRGEVDVEPVAGDQPPAENSHARAVFQKLTLTALQTVKIQKGQRPTAARKLETTEAEAVLAKTDKLMVASLAATTPSNVIPTSYELTAEIASNPERKKAAAAAAFTSARRAATLSPTPDNVNALADAYKDLGAGKRAVKEYQLAGSGKPELQNSVKFLAGLAEAYRLAGNLTKADEKSKEAVTKSERAGATPFQKQLALTARGNVAYDVAVQHVGAGKGRTASTYFEQAKALYRAADTGQTSSEISRITYGNLENASLAIHRGDGRVGAVASRDEPPNIMGTYRGVLTFGGARLASPATLVINGDRLSLIECSRTLSGSILRLKRQERGFSFDLILDGNTPIKKVSLTGTLPDRGRIELASAPEERYRFSFSSNPKQQPLRCLRPYSPR